MRPALHPLRITIRPASAMTDSRADMLQGTLDLLVLKALSLGPMHGWGVSQRIQQLSSDVLQVNQGSLYPALHRLEHRGWIASEWGTSENNWRAKYYLSLPRGGGSSIRSARTGLASRAPSRSYWRRCAWSRRRPHEPPRPLAQAALAAFPGCRRARARRRAPLPSRDGDGRESPPGDGSRRRPPRGVPALRGGGALQGAGAGRARDPLGGGPRARRAALRPLARSPSFAATALLTIALGVGATTAVFSVVRGVLLRPLPFPEPQELVTVWLPLQGIDEDVTSYPNFVDWREGSTTLSHVVGMASTLRTLTGGGEPEEVRSVLVTSGLPDRPPPVAPARGPPQAELDFDQTPAFDPTEGDPGPDFDFDQSLPEDMDL